jgi:hypothetical protein
MFKKFLSLGLVILALSSCGQQSEKVEPLKRTDKNLNCDDIQLEINEAEFYKKQALDNKRLGIKSIVMPLGYIDTFMSADEAIEAAEARIQYLNRIFDIKKCDTKEGKAASNSQSSSGSESSGIVGYTASGAPIYSSPSQQQNYYQQRRY